MPSLAVNCSILFQEADVLARPQLARDAGYDAVEFWWPFDSASPSDTEVDRFVEAVCDAGVSLIGLNFAAGMMPAGDRGLLSWVGREQEFRDSVEVAMHIAERTGTKAFNALYGNRLDGVDPAAQDELALSNLAWAATRASAIGAVVLLEPVSGAPRYPLLTGADVVAVIRSLEAASEVKNVKLLADIYHLTANGDDVMGVINSYGAQIGHVQVADAPGRHRPGTGRIDFRVLLGAIYAAGYGGHVALEYVPERPTAEDLALLNHELLTPVTDDINRQSFTT